MEPVAGGIEPERDRVGQPAPDLLVHDSLTTGPTALQQPAWIDRSWQAQALALPNLLTYLRFVAVPFFCWAFITGRAELALILFVSAAATDGLDGLLARALRMQTRLGTFLDPIADKVLTFAALILLVARQELPVWLLGLVVVRDGGIALAAAHLRKSRILVPSTPSRFGKYATFTLLATIALALIRPVHPSAALDGYIAATLVLAMQCVSIAIVQYFLRWRRLMQAQ